MALYGEKQRQMEELERLRKKQAPSAGSSVKRMTDEERQRKLQEMQDYAKKVDEDRTRRLYGGKAPAEHGEKEDTTSGKKDAKFLRDMSKQVYLDSDMKLEERLNRKAHYVARDATRD